MNACSSRSIVFILVMASLVLVVAPSAAQEESWLPAPTGPYQVGTTLYHWVDDGRDEVFTEDPTDKRELVVQVWYPANVPEGAEPVTYFIYGELEAPYFDMAMRSEVIRLGDVSEQLSRTLTHSYREAPLSSAEERYPVLLYSPGVPGIPASATIQFEELASHGYVVVSINHPYMAGWTVFPDQHVVTILPDEAFTPEMVEKTSVEVGAQDQVFVLDQLTLLDQSAPDALFSGRLDLDRVGTFGVSWGAWVSALASLVDGRFKAALIQQPHGIFPAAANEAGLDLPIMFMDPGGDTSRAAMQNMRGPAYRLALGSMAGFSLGDFLLWPAFRDGLPPWDLGAIQPARAAQIVNAYTLAFFDQYLKGEESPLLDGPSPDYPEVGIETRNLD